MKPLTLITITTLIGLLAGFLYYYFFGCTSNCMISSSPVNSMLYGGVMGVLMGFSFKKERK